MQPLVYHTARSSNSATWCRAAPDLRKGLELRTGSCAWSCDGRLGLQTSLLLFAKTLRNLDHGAVVFILSDVQRSTGSGIQQL